MVGTGGLDAGTQLPNIHFTGYLTGATLLGMGEIVPSSATTLKLGDINQDGHVNAADILVMLTALTDLKAYKAGHPGFDDAAVADVFDLNGDGEVTNADIQGELDLIASENGGSVATVPEPASLMLFGLGGLMCIGRRFPASQEGIQL
jgi:hypothetical protein